MVKDIKVSKNKYGSSKFSTYYFIWTYRYINCGNIIIKDLGSMTVEGNERTIPLSGIPPLYTPGIKIGQRKYR